MHGKKLTVYIGASVARCTDFAATVVDAAALAPRGNLSEDSRDERDSSDESSLVEHVDRRTEGGRVRDRKWETSGLPSAALPLSFILCPDRAQPRSEPKHPREQRIVRV
jgi:hypothetical protein